MEHRCVLKSVVCVCMLHCSAVVNIYSHITTDLSTHRCTMIDYFNKV